jgi:hypothetical protein
MVGRPSAVIASILIGLSRAGRARDGVIQAPAR